MFITKSFHKSVVSELEKDNRRFRKDYFDLLNKVDNLTEQLATAQNLKDILAKLVDKTTPPLLSINGDSSWFTTTKLAGSDGAINLEGYAQLVTDFATGEKVFKHQALTNCIKISKNGVVTEGKTVQKADKGYTYKLIKE